MKFRGEDYDGNEERAKRAPVDPSVARGEQGRGSYD